jgi:predicted permease
MKRAKALFDALLLGYPAPFRHEYGSQMRLDFAEQLRDARRTGSRRDEARLWGHAAADVFTVAPREHWHVMRQDLRDAFRAMVAAPAFAAVAILSLALGIGANTAIFSVWHSTVRAALPGVDAAHDLVMLTNPDESGLLRGGWRSRTDGPRAWLTYAEFEQLRDHASGFSSLMASQSSLNTWQLRVDRGGFEAATGRLVSGEFFEVLGVRPARGRLFSRSEDAGESPLAVLSHAYWQRRFGGRHDVLGRTLTIRETTVTIIGVAADGFLGETSGQRPDLWLPLRLQPRVVAGSDWLQDRPPDKVMWLHVFGRLRPDVTMVQAETQANAVFQAGLESFYGAVTGERRTEVLDQQLRLQAAARGASATRAQLSPSLTLLLAAAGILLLIACANLANLLLARGSARHTEMAVRLSLGASRPRLIRQLLTESLALAALGGVAAIAVAWVLHRALVWMLRDVEPDYVARFALELPILGYAVASTVAAALAFGVVPAWQVARAAPAAGLATQGRGAISSARELRSGRWLVAAQLALSLPLLVGAGLLVRTVYSLQQVDLGFRPERLLVARVNLPDLVQNGPRRDRVLREMLVRLRQVPGVEVATYSQLGLFTGGISTAGIDVDGGLPGGERSSGSALDRVGADYFTTLGVPLIAGRDIADGDTAESPKVCVVNDAFVRRFLAGRQPIGRTVTADADSQSRTAYQVVGVVGNPRIGDLRGDVEPRFYVPAEQRPSLGSTRTFLIRTGAQPGSVVGAVRDVLNAVDTRAAVSTIVSLEEQMAPLTADERVIARLGLVFGSVSLALAAVGLYGVLAYAVSRRSRELAIRMAVGAQRRDVVAMILRESAAIVFVGLMLGGGLAYPVTRVIASRLHGVAPQDPLTMSLAAGVLVIVAALAAYVPARRASRVDPMVALHQV